MVGHNESYLLMFDIYIPRLDSVVVDDQSVKNFSSTQVDKQDFGRV